MVITKREDVTKQGFCKTLWRKLRLRASLLLVLIPFWGVVGVRGWVPISVWVGVGGGWGRGGRLFEARRLLTFSAFRMGAFSRWVLIRGWALIRINTVPLWRDFTEEEAFTSWQITAAFLDKSCSSALGPTKNRNNSLSTSQTRWFQQSLRV